MGKFIAGFLAGIGLLSLIASSLIGLMGASYKSNLDEAKKAVDEVYVLTHSPKYNAVIEGLRLIEATANTLSGSAQTMDSIAPDIQKVKESLEATAPLLATLRGPLKDLSVFLQNPPPLLPPSVAANGRQLGNFLQAVVPLIPNTGDLVRQVSNLPTVPSAAISRISATASDAQSKLLQVRSKSEEAYNLLHSTGFQVFEIAIGYWWILAVLGGILFATFSLLGGGKMVGVIAIVLMLCVMGVAVGLRPMISTAATPTPAPLQPIATPTPTPHRPIVTPAATPPPAPLQPRATPIAPLAPPPKSTPTPATIGQMLLSETISLAPLDMTSLDRLERQGQLPQPPFNLYGYHTSKLFYLTKGQMVNITLESDYNITWEKGEGKRTADISASIDWVQKDNPLVGAHWSSGWTESIIGDGSRMVKIVLRPDESGFYMLWLVNYTGNSHYFRYTVEYP